MAVSECCRYVVTGLHNVCRPCLESLRAFSCPYTCKCDRFDRRLHKTQERVQLVRRIYAIKNSTQNHEETISAYGRLENRYRFGDGREYSEDKWSIKVFQKKKKPRNLAFEKRTGSFELSGLDSYIWTVDESRHLGRNHFVHGAPHYI